MFNALTIGKKFSFTLSATLALTLSAHAAQKSGDKIEIVGGTTVAAGELEAETTVAFLSGGGLCTASIIAEDLAVTAAHCVLDESGNPVDPSDMALVFSTEVSASSIQTQVLGAVFNPKFLEANNTGVDMGDIALIRFSGGLPSGYGIANLLPESETLVDGESVELAGYGVTEMIDQAGAGTLRKVDVPIKDAGFGQTEVLLDQTGGQGACHGDSGGPAFIKNDSGLFLWGITNRGNPDDAPDDCIHFSVYTKISSYKSFLDSATTTLRAI